MKNWWNPIAVGVALVQKAENYTAQRATGDCSRNSIGITARSWIYRFLDIVLMKIRFRHRVDECRNEDIDEVPPNQTQENLKRNEDYWKVWQTIYDNAVRLLLHDDNLNWQKFYVLLSIISGIFAAYIISIKEQSIYGQFLFIFLGLVSSWAFDRTMQEGMRCLRSHKSKVNKLEIKVTDQQGHFLLYKNPYNQRDALEIVPIFLFGTWFFMLLFQPFHMIFWPVIPPAPHPPAG